MFTGIIEHVAKIEALDRTERGGSLWVNFAGAADISRETKLGDSIAVNGCCLTVADLSEERFAADLSSETLQRTSLGEKKPGDSVNLERPLALSAVGAGLGLHSRLGGHFVQGHVDGTGRVTRLARQGDTWWLSVRVPEDLRRYAVEKGSIAIDGISLTVARWQDGIADFAVVPFTYEHTNVHALVPGDAVNIESDILAKYVENMIGARKTPSASRLSVSKLVEEGF
ncbi:MAG: riboflavin synthase [Candidatus Acidiferrales bacterium]